MILRARFCSEVHQQIHDSQQEVVMMERLLKFE
jgi:hypothetical protein